MINKNMIYKNMITVNNFSAHWIKEMDMKRCGDDLEILASTVKSIYCFSDPMLKEMPKDALELLKKPFYIENKK